MSYWPSKKAKQVYRALLSIGWRIKAEKGSSHVKLVHNKYGEYTWAFPDSEEIGPKMMSRIAVILTPNGDSP